VTSGHGGGGGTAKARRGERAHLIRGALVLAIALAVVLAAILLFFRYFGTEESGPSLACTARLYSPYNPKNLEQCMTVCMVCSAGVKTTCSTSCMLKGAR